MSINKTRHHFSFCYSMKQRLFYNLAITAWAGFFSVSIFGCNSDTRQQAQSVSIQETADLAREQVIIKFAKGFTLSNHDHFRVLNIFTNSGIDKDSTTYLLLERGTPIPEGFENTNVITTPIRSLVAMSSMHVGMLQFLEAESVLVGLSNTQYVFSQKVIAKIDSGKISEIGHDQGINQEKLIVLKPDLLMTMGSPNATSKQYPVVAQAGIPMLANSEWLETTPLARAEWVKLLAVLLHKESIANEKFGQIEEKYNALLQLTSNVSKHPTIVSGINTKDTWYMPSGENYMALFFANAGGSYPWKNTKGLGSVALNFEAVYPEALKADFWLNVGFDPKDTKKSLLALDKRYADFNAFKKGNIYSYNNSVNNKGSNDFFESGLMAPEVILADIIKILHPELLPKHQLVYYKQLQ